MSNTPTTLAGFSGPVLLFLKATVKKQVFIPTYTRHDGVVVPGHWTSVHVADDHDGHKILAGDGTHSQKQAHKALSKHAWFNELPHDHKVHVLMEHATEIQDKASASAALSTVKKKVLAGQKLTDGDWKAFDSAPDAKQEAMLEAFKAAGKEDAFGKMWFDWQAANPPKVATAPITPASFEAPKPAPAAKPEFVPKIIKTSYDGQPVVITELESGGYGLSVDGRDYGRFSTSNAAQGFAHKLVFDHGEPAAVASAPKIVTAAEKPAPAAPAVAKPDGPAVGPNAAMGAHMAAIEAAKLPPSNTNAKGVNAKLDAIAKATAAGDVKTLLMMGYGSNNYGHKAVALANKSLALLGSSHTVTAGQKMASHAGLKDAPSAAAGAPAAAPAEPATPASDAAVPASLSVPDGYPVPSAAVNEQKAAKALKMAQLGDLAGLAAFHDKLLAPKTKAYVGEVLEAAKAKWAAASSGAAPSAAAGATQFGDWHFHAKDDGFSGHPALALEDKTPGIGYYIVKDDEGGYQFFKLNEDGEGGDSPEPFASLEKLKEGLKIMGLDVPSAALDHLASAPIAQGSAAPAVAAAAEPTPKEGDTKQGADGMLVFQNGRWHKVGGNVPAPAATAKVKLPVQVFHNTNPGHNKYWNVGVHGKHLVTNYGKMGSAGQHTVKSYASEAEAKAAMQKIIGEKLKGGYHKVDVLGAHYTVDLPVDGAASPPAAAPAPKPAPKVVTATQTATAAPESIDGWQKVAGQQGYNEGGTYVDAAGVKWYCKFPAGGEKVVKNELLASKLYELAGVDTAQTKLIKQGGKVGIASKIIDGAKQDKAALLAGKAPGLLSGFAVDAWLANWDTVGNNPAKGYDNILIKPDGSAVRIDSGGALLYGGAGGKKQVFKDKVIELKTMLDPNKNAHTSAVFGKMSQADIAASVAKVAAIPDGAIKAFCEEYGPGDLSQRKRLADTLIARKADMLAQYPHVAKMAEKVKDATTKPTKAKPDPTALKVDASLLPKPHNFLNWNGSGKPISDKPYVAQNVKDEQAILDFALKGNLVALKEYKFQPVDKMTGQPVGDPKPMSEHPSAHVRDFYDNCVSFLEVVANPPEPLRTFSGKAANTVEQLASLFKPFDYGVSVAKAPANQRLGFWIALGSVANPAKFKPAKIGMKLSAGAKAAAYETFKKLPGTVTTFIHAVQGSGSNNQPYRDGKDKDNQGQDTRTVLTDLYKNAVAHPEGTTINKWIEMPDSMIQQFLKEPPGLVFQNPGSMCTSQHEKATSGFGKHRVVIHYAKGASAIDTFGSGGFAGEAEITTLPGARFMVLDRKMVSDVEHGNPNGQRLELEVLMLPPDPTYVSNLKKKV